MATPSVPPLHPHFPLVPRPENSNRVALMEVRERAQKCELGLPTPGWGYPGAMGAELKEGGV